MTVVQITIQQGEWRLNRPLDQKLKSLAPLFQTIIRKEHERFPSCVQIQFSKNALGGLAIKRVDAAKKILQSDTVAVNFTNEELNALQSLHVPIEYTYKSSFTFPKDTGDLDILFSAVIDLPLLEKSLIIQRQQEMLKKLIQDARLPNEWLLSLHYFCEKKGLTKLLDILSTFTPKKEVQAFRKKMTKLDAYIRSLMKSYTGQYPYDVFYVYLKVQSLVDPQHFQATFDTSGEVLTALFEFVAHREYRAPSVKNVLRKFIEFRHKNQMLNLTMDSFFRPLQTKGKETVQEVCQFLKAWGICSENPLLEACKRDDFSNHDVELCEEITKVFPDWLLDDGVISSLLLGDVADDIKIATLDLANKITPLRPVPLGPLFLRVFAGRSAPLQHFAKYFNYDLKSYFEKMSGQDEHENIFYNELMRLLLQSRESNQEMCELILAHFPLVKDGVIQTAFFAGCIASCDCQLNDLLEEFITHFVLPKFADKKYDINELYLYGLSFVKGKVSSKSHTPLHTHIAEGNIEKAREIIASSDIYLHFLDELGYSPIMRAAQCGHVALYSALHAKGTRLDFEKNEQFLEEFLAQHAAVEAFFQLAGEEEIQALWVAIKEKPDALATLLKHCPEQFLPQFLKQEVLEVDFAPFEALFIECVSENKFQVAHLILERVGTNNKLSEAGIEKLFSKITTPRQLEFLFEECGDELLSQHGKFLQHGKWEEPKLVCTWYEHLKQSQRIDFHYQLIINISEKLKTNPDFLDIPEEGIVPETAFSVVLREAFPHLTDREYKEASVNVKYPYTCACFIEKKVPVAQWAGITKCIVGSGEHITRLKRVIDRQLSKYLTDIFAGIVNPHVECSEKNAEYLRTLILSAKSEEQLAYVLNVLQTSPEPHTIESTVQLAKDITLEFTTLKSRFLREDSPEERLKIVRYISLTRARRGISVLTHCIKAEAQVPILIEALQALGRLHINLPPDHIERILLLVELHKDTQALKRAAIGALWATTHDPHHPQIVAFLLQELAANLRKENHTQDERAYILKLIECLANYEVPEYAQGIFSEIIAYVDRLIHRKEDEEHLVDVIIALHRYTNNEVLEKVRECIHSPLWNVFDRSYGENLQDHKGPWFLFLNPDRGIHFNRDSMERRILLKRLQSRQRELQQEIDATYQEYVAMPEKFPHLVDIDTRFQALEKSTRFVGIEEICYEESGILYRGLKARKGQALYNVSIIDTILGGCISADLTSMQEQFDNASWAKTGQIFCSQAKSTAALYSGMNEGQREGQKESQVGHLILIDPSYIQARLDNAQARNEFEGGSLNPVIYEGIDKRGIQKIIMDKKYEKDFTSLYGLTPIADLRKELGNTFFKELSDAELKLIRFHLREHFPSFTGAFQEPYFSRFVFVDMAERNAMSRVIEEAGYKDLTMEAIREATIKRAIGCSVVQKEKSPIDRFREILSVYSDEEFQQNADTFVEKFTISDQLEKAQSKRTRNTSIFEKTKSLIKAQYGLPLKTELGCTLMPVEKVRKILRLAALFLFTGRLQEKVSSSQFALQTLPAFRRLYDIPSGVEQKLVVSLLEENRKIDAVLRKKVTSDEFLKELEKSYTENQFSALVSFDEYLRMLFSLFLVPWTDRKKVNNDPLLIAKARTLWNTLSTFTKEDVPKFFNVSSV